MPNNSRDSEPLLTWLARDALALVSLAIFMATVFVWGSILSERVDYQCFRSARHGCRPEAGSVAPRRPTMDVLSVLRGSVR